MNRKINNKKILSIIFIVVIIISILLRIKGIYFESIDMTKCLYKWFDFLKNNGGLKALKFEIGDYNVPYITILAILSYMPFNSIVSIKIISIIFDYLLAFFCVKLVKEIKREKYNKEMGMLVFSIIIILPTVILNSAYWGQCDSIYATFIIISLIYLIREKYLASFIFLGVSFAFKLQFIFVLPLYVLYFLSKRKMPIHYFLIIPIFLLPYMHDRYMFVADILSVIYCIIKGKNKIYVPVCVNLCSTYTYIVFLSRTKILFNDEIKFFTLINCIVVIVLTINLYKELAQTSNKSKVLKKGESR